jgi:hypothetical protein
MQNEKHPSAAIEGWLSSGQYNYLMLVTPLGSPIARDFNGGALHFKRFHLGALKLSCDVVQEASDGWLPDQGLRGWQEADSIVRPQSQEC